MLVVDESEWVKEGKTRRVREEVCVRDLEQSMVSAMAVSHPRTGNVH